jgi:signal transduction histidine kinase
LIVDVSPLKRRDHSRDVARRMAQIGDGLEAFCSELLKVFGLSAPAAKAGPAPASEFERLMSALSRLSTKTLDRRRAKHFSDNLRRLIAPERLRIEAMNLNDLISSSPDLAQDDDTEVRLRVVAGAGLWPVDCDKARLNECLRELVANAAAAGGGSNTPVSIETRNLRVTRDFAATRPALTQGDYVRVSVRDQGSGMSAEVVERAITPFFRSGSRSLGMGLGLSAVFVTISRLGGHMEIESELDRGTTIHLYLPRSASSAPDARSSAAGKRGKQGAS